MLGCTRIYAPEGVPLAQLPQQEEGLALVQLALLQPAAAAQGCAKAGATLAGSELAAVLGAAAVASADAGPDQPYARYCGGYVVEPVSWHMCLGFPLMESLGSLAYHCWSGRQRRRIAQAIAAQGTWQGRVPPLDSRPAWWRCMLAAAGLAGAAAAVAIALRSR